MWPHLTWGVAGTYCKWSAVAAILIWLLGFTLVFLWNISVEEFYCWWHDQMQKMEHGKISSAVTVVCMVSFIHQRRMTEQPRVDLTN